MNLEVCKSGCSLKVGPLLCQSAHRRSCISTSEVENNLSRIPFSVFLLALICSFLMDFFFFFFWYKCTTSIMFLEEVTNIRPILKKFLTAGPILKLCF